MYNYGGNNQTEKMMEQIEKLRKKITRMEEEHKNEINSIIMAFEDEKARILSNIAKTQKCIFAISIDAPSVIVELVIHEVNGKYIKCYEGHEERIFSVEDIGRRIAFNIEDFEQNKSDILNLKKKTSQYKMLSVIPSEDPIYWPPKNLGGLHHY